ncbi:hypothetical protein EV421DRAFT_2024077 [Armillaria borealis]|uniref:Transmembrane protein n=1 Tax=Armillaria borealis TaxID=47425 RepID=A0AA39IXE5_9AGAR|nr:hypothetical protein EV421DRAFT_2024077 [Armillaria borealis]
MAVACQSSLPNDSRSSHDIALVSVDSCSQTGLTETDLNPSNGHPLLHGFRLSSITRISSTVHNSAADALQNSLDVHLPPARPTSGQGGLSSGFEEPQPSTAAQRRQNQDGASNSTLQDVHPRIKAVMPDYARIFRLRQRKPYELDPPPLAPLMTSFYLHGVPSDWSSHVHPQGPRYYAHEIVFHTSANTSSPSSVFLLQVFTEADIVVPGVFYICAKGISLPLKVDLFLGLRWFRDGTVTCGYYFADHVHRSVFWLDDVDVGALSISGVVTTEPSHLAHAIEARYWFHRYLFPVCQEMTSDIIEEVNDFLINCLAEVSDKSYARYGFTLPELQRYLSVVTTIMNSPGSYYRPGSLCVVAKIMENCSRNRYVEFYGEPGAYLGPPVELDRDIYKRLRTPLISLLSPFLFFAPDSHHIVLHEIFHNGLTKVDWSAFIRKLSTEWQEFVINATVLLNANIAFLGIQSIDDSSVDKGRSPAQIASYVSTVVSIGSISLGLLLLQKNRYKDRVYTTSKFEFLGLQEGESGRRLGLETLAIMYSLPWALLMWAMIFFLAAFCLMCFTTSSLSVRMIVGSPLFAIGILIFWHLTISRELYELRWYVRAHVHLVNAWYRLSWELSTHLPAKFNMDWMKRMLRMSSNDVEMASMDSSTTASLDNDEATTCSHETTSMSSYETTSASSHATISSYDTASMRSHVTDVDVV